MSDRPTPSVVLVLTGLPGTGKSTVAEAVGRAIGAPVFSGDWLLGALKPSGVLSKLDHSVVVDLSDRLLRTLITRQLMLGQSAIVDTIINDELANEWASAAVGSGARFLVVECVCTDERLHRERVGPRTRNIPGWHEIGWDHVERMREAYVSPDAEHLTIDAVSSLDGNVRSVVEYLRS
jgi:predicted kinase